MWCLVQSLIVCYHYKINDSPFRYSYTGIYPRQVTHTHTLINIKLVVHEGQLNKLVINGVLFLYVFVTSCVCSNPHPFIQTGRSMLLGVPVIWYHIVFSGWVELKRSIQEWFTHANALFGNLAWRLPSFLTNHRVHLECNISGLSFISRYYKEAVVFGFDLLHQLLIVFIKLSKSANYINYDTEWNLLQCEQHCAKSEMTCALFLSSSSISTCFQWSIKKII